MSVTSLGFQHLGLRSAEEVHEVFRLLGYDVYDQELLEKAELKELELNEGDHPFVECV